ncbi:hypothetical protein [Streptomyces carpinensis]|uniref:hypothetical protein n=1 Tax=Streptomyces carpinensis TaxID=66369 RepID=UPI001FCA3D12|nr:hypothetical protein [Streptomyces carpinensis]
MHHSTDPASLSSVVAMGLSGFVPAAVVPAVLMLARRSPLWQRVSVPAGVALPLLVLLHAGVVLGGLPHDGLPGGAWVSEPVLLAAAVLFWIPVLARTRHRLGDAGRCLYLFLAAPLLDLPAVGVVAAGQPAQGIAMIAGMLPIGVAAAAITWSWANREERLAARTLVPSPEGGPHAP